jgi:ABC-type multidrug transport system permease subunit
MNELNGSASPLAQLVLARFREFIREPEAIFWVLVFPILLAAGLGIAFRDAPPTIVKVAAATPGLADALRSEKLLDVRQLPAAEAQAALRMGRVALVAESGPDGGVSYRFDDTSADARTARMLADRAVQHAGGQTDPVPVRDVLMAEPGSRYIDFFVPGLLGMNLMSSAIWGLGYTIVDARRRKLIRRLIATPMQRSSYLLSFILYRLSMMIVEAGAILAFGVLVFHVPLRGSVASLGLVCVMTTLASTALGLLIASRVQTIEAATGLMNFIVIPMWIASGVFFSAQQFPELLQPVINILPLTASIDALRANMLQGAGLAQIFPQLAILAAWMIGCFGLALKIFRWH